MALVSSVTVDLPNQHPTVVLRETESPRRQLTFSIALPDGVALSHALRRIPTPRPLTHELLSGILQRLRHRRGGRAPGRPPGLGLLRRARPAGTDGRSVHSCRPSDALTVALLQPVPVPILIDRRLFEAGRRRDPAGARHRRRELASGRPPAQPPVSSRRRRSSFCSYWAWSAASAAAPPSSEMRMSRAIST